MKHLGYLLLLLLVAAFAFYLFSPNVKATQAAAPALSIHPLQESSPAGGEITGKPSISVAFINAILCAYSSPTCGKGQALFDQGVKYGIDPAYALAFFLNESSFGRAGWAVVNHSLGNIRCTAGYACNGGYRAYASWEQGFADWYQLLRNLYIGAWHLSTVEKIIPRYAPGADHNDEAHYIAVVTNAVALWRAGKVAIP